MPDVLVRKGVGFGVGLFVGDYVLVLVQLVGRLEDLDDQGSWAVGC